MTSLQLIDHPQTNRWHNTISWGDIVSFDLPSRTILPETKKSTISPWLILDRNTNVGEEFVTMAPGSTECTLPHKAEALLVSGQDRIRAAGLSCPTLFDCEHAMIVSVKHHGFVLTKNSSPIIGHLIGDDRHRLNSIRARLDAFADIAKERRAELGRRQQGIHTAPTHMVSQDYEPGARRMKSRGAKF
ncbi:hypothetical protein [uncultured Cohaesibacter sp.]|uniref:hypothetical protein n=1 Tax=uncultured Cohaesibacter sp. TaxID=1002546 RepID=UPI0029C722A2|nr:hypothetical protein [uncultured Cohaesibacter sp.]